MGGSKYERRDSVPQHSSLRERMRAELEAFGPYAVRTDTQGIEPGSISPPVRRGTTGETVIASFAIASGPGAGADAPECLATFKPDRPSPYHAAFLITALANELTEFARSRLLSGRGSFPLLVFACHETSSMCPKSACWVAGGTTLAQYISGCTVSLCRL
ncbi:hypothetical protein QFZ33_003665 [Arthrobacter globiformis]|nr:hypothetical protein [Arthrobacter globiformis]